MRKPPASVYLLGSSPGMVAVIGGTCLVIYQWWIGQVASGWVPLLAVLAAGAAVRANERLTSYRKWKEAWESMGGSAPKSAGRPSRKSSMRVVVCVVLWPLMAIGLLGMNYHNRPDHAVMAGCFVVGNLVLLGRAFRARRQSTARAKPQKLVMVSTPLPVPRSSPSVQQCLQVLPGYCGRLS